MKTFFFALFFPFFLSFKYRLTFGIYYIYIHTYIFLFLFFIFFLLFILFSATQRRLVDTFDHETGKKKKKIFFQQIFMKDPPPEQEHDNYVIERLTPSTYDGTDDVASEYIDIQWTKNTRKKYFSNERTRPCTFFLVCLFTTIQI